MLAIAIQALADDITADASLSNGGVSMSNTVSGFAGDHMSKVSLQTFFNPPKKFVIGCR